MKTLLPIRKCLIASVLLWWCPTLALAQTVRDFDTSTGTPFLAKNCVPSNPGAAPPQELPGGPTGAGNFLRLATTTPPLPISNSIAFDLTDPGLFSQIVAEFDFRMTPGNGRADGFGFALLNTASYGNSGQVCPTLSPFAPEEPNFIKSLGVGFDIYQNTDLGDVVRQITFAQFGSIVHLRCQLAQLLDASLGECVGHQNLHVVSVLSRWPMVSIRVCGNSTIRSGFPLRYKRGGRDFTHRTPSA